MERAHANLRTPLWPVRRADPGLVTTDGGTVRLGDAVSVDLHDALAWAHGMLAAGDEALGDARECREVSDSITWRQFCRIGFDQPVPHPTTLMKLTTRCGSAAVDGLNEALLAKAAEGKLLRCTRVRVDTTVVPSNVAYPTDSGLLAKAVRRIAATGRRSGPPVVRSAPSCGTGPGRPGGGPMT